LSGVGEKLRDLDSMMALIFVAGTRWRQAKVRFPVQLASLARVNQAELPTVGTVGC
jgi:hypothetical protein